MFRILKEKNDIKDYYYKFIAILDFREFFQTNSYFQLF